MLRFRNPDSFVAGNLTTCLEQWDQISVGFEKRNFVLSIIRNGVDVFDFFTPFNGTFQGKTYCSDLPPRMCLPNSVACHPFKEFITATVKDRICNSSINVVGVLTKSNHLTWFCQLQFSLVNLVCATMNVF